MNWSSSAVSAKIEEKERLSDLYSLQLLDTEPEQRFDQLTELVGVIFDVPLCFITFLDVHRQWVKSAYGWETQETPISESFCCHSLDQELLMVLDTLDDPEFSHKPAVTGEMGIRFYAGALLRSENGQPLGRLCIMDHRPRQLTLQQQWCLTRFAALANQEVHFDERLESVREELSSAALRDPITGLPGQLVTEERAAIEVARCRESERCLAVVNVQFRRHDELLAIYGSHQVNQVACIMAERLLSLVGDRGFVGRPAADRMLVVSSQFVSPEEARDWCQQVYTALVAPFRFEGGSRSADVALGASVAPSDGRSASELLSHAILASNEWDRQGLNFYSGERSKAILFRDRMVDRLTMALENGDIELAFQPVFLSHNNEPYTCEALARWEDEQLGRVSPGDFIPLAEADPRLSRLLSRLVLRQACESAMLWNQGRSIPVPVNVNIAGPEFMQPDFVDEVEAILDQAGLPHHLLVLELTEQTVIGDVARVADTIRLLRERGVFCALDDFGTGYSSLSYLRGIPFAALKIDQSFLQDIMVDPTAVEVARGIVNIGKALNMTVVAEGVETGEQQTLLKEIGCEALQGFYLARPMPLSQVLKRLNE